MFQRIGWRRPTTGERRLWWIQGAVIVSGVLIIGVLILAALR